MIKVDVNDQQRSPLGDDMPHNAAGAWHGGRQPGFRVRAPGGQAGELVQIGIEQKDGALGGFQEFVRAF